MAGVSLRRRAACQRFNSRAGGFVRACYRYVGDNQHLAALAAGIAASCVSIRGSIASYGDYDYGGAVKSPFRFKQRSHGRYQPTRGDSSLLTHEPTTFFCSNFVYKVYAEAAHWSGMANVPIKYGRDQIGPRDLMIAMDASGGNWRNEGQYRQQ
jgi:hypothetical protein